MPFQIHSADHPNNAGRYNDRRITFAEFAQHIARHARNAGNPDQEKAAKDNTTKLHLRTMRTQAQHSNRPNIAALLSEILKSRTPHSAQVARLACNAFAEFIAETEKQQPGIFTTGQPAPDDQRDEQRAGEVAPPANSPAAQADDRRAGETTAPVKPRRTTRRTTRNTRRITRAGETDRPRPRTVAQARAEKI